MIVEENVIKDDFPVGMRVLAVDDDPAFLRLLENLLVRCQYNVTTTTRAVTALNLLRENRDKFDLVISDVHMPDMDGFKLLELVGLEMDLPVIMLSANGERQAVMRGITHGACDYLLKPVRMQELRNIWQHVIRRKSIAQRQINDSNSGENSQRDQVADSEGSQWVNDHSSRLKNKQLDRNEEGKVNEENIQENEDSSSQKKPRIVWSIELHRKFVAAVNQLGIDKAVPKKILDIMNVEHLTRENVASHLQKYRLYLKRLSAVTGQHASVASALKFRNLSSVNMESLDVFRNYHALGRSRQLPALTSLQPNGVPDRMNSPSLPGTHMSSQAAELDHIQHNPVNPIDNLGMHQDIRLTRNFQPSLLNGVPTPFELGQLQQPNVAQEANSSSDAGSGATASLCGNSFANVANNLPLLQANKQQLEHGGLGDYSSVMLPSLSADTFDIDLQDLSQFSHVGMSNETWQYAVPASEHSANTWARCAPFSHKNSSLCQIGGDNLSSVAITPLTERQDQVNLFGGCMMTMSAGSSEDARFSNIRSSGNSQQEWHHIVDQSSTMGSSLFSSLPDLGANENLQHQKSVSGLHNKTMNANETGQTTFGVPVLQYNCMVDKTAMECQQNYRDEDGLENTKSFSGMSSLGCNYGDIDLSML